MLIFYFTATGNSLYAAKQIGGTLRSIPQLMRGEERSFSDDVIGFVFPCYAWGLPRMVREFVLRSTFRADYFFGVMTYGNISGGGLSSLAATGMKAGIVFDYTAELKMVDNYLPMFEMGDQIAHQADKNIEANLARIVADVRTRTKRVTRKNPFWRAGSWLAQRFFDRFGYDGVDRKFVRNDDCNGCGICEKVCPKKNIRMEGKPVFLHQCDCCYACIQLCPQTALHLKNEKSDARFRNAGVALAEIVEANR